MSNYEDNFPPNKWLDKSIMKTPGRFLLFMVAVFVGLGLLPLSVVHMVGVVAVFIFIPLATVMMVWQVIWWKQHPLAPPEYCDKCGHILPRHEVVAQKIEETKAAGLYDALEHQTSGLDLWEDEGGTSNKEE